MRYLTFDIEDWFHILDNPKTKTPEQWQSFPKRIHIGLDIILNLCSRHKIRGIFFCLGWIAEMYPELVKKIHNHGHTIGTHGYAHQLVYEQTEAEFRDDLLKSIGILENITKEKITAYRAPGFSITKDCLWAFDVLCKCGIQYDSSVFPAPRAHGGLQSISVYEPFLIKTLEGNELIELPISSKHVFGKTLIFGGGGYFRILPFYLLRKWFGESTYIMTYFHPRDFDANQPSIPGLSLVRKFKAYYGISRTEKKLDGVLKLQKFDGLMTDVHCTTSVDLNNIKPLS